jgi:MoxR-like ATPase
VTVTRAPAATQGAKSADLEDVDSLLRPLRALRTEIAKQIIGQTDVVDEVLMALLAGGHALLIGVPGLAKTLLIKSLAEATHLDFRRIQFTPDLVPSDITGTELLEEDSATGHRSFRFVKGPIFTNIALADEVNRAPPRTQAALLEAMQEHRVTAAGETMPLPEPFFVLATQNPIEQEGTYPLPEAQLDRFLFAINIGYPTVDDEVRILQSTTGRETSQVRPVIDGAQMIALKGRVRDVAVAEPVVRYAAALVRASRPGPNAGDGSEPIPARVRKYVRWGAGPRAGQALVLGAKAWAFMAGRMAVTPGDVVRVAKPVLRHRVLTNFAAQADGVRAEDLIDDVLASVPGPRSDIRL